MVSFGSRRIGDGFPCFITFEAGPTHDGLASAKRLVDAAGEAGADAVKFQLLDPDRLVADRALPFSYDVLVDRSTGRTETVTEPLHDILCRRTLSTSEWRTLKRHSDDAEIAFFATALFEDEVDFLAGLGCDSIKIRVRRCQPFAAAASCRPYRVVSAARYRQRHNWRDRDGRRRHQGRG